MMKRPGVYILFLIILNVATTAQLCAAQEAATDTVSIDRPVMEYKSGRFRDPFKTYLIKEEPKPVLEESVEVPKPQFDFSKISIQGIVWGVDHPQAIINDRVFTVGDTIEGAQILSIDKKGITLNFYGEILDLSSPRQGAVPKETKK
jgi:hypothetical protein